MWEAGGSCPKGDSPPSQAPPSWQVAVDRRSVDHSVNAGISEELASITYAHVDDAVECIKTPPFSSKWIWKVRICRQIPVHPGDHHLLGVSWEGRTYVDRALPFVLHSAPKIFSAVADMMVWALYNAGIEHLFHYMDDFLFLVAPHSDDGAKVRSLAMSVFSKLGVPVALHKPEGPACVITFLSICIDTIEGELRLPQDKLHRLQKLIKVWSTKRASTKKELESFLGHLSHAATVVHPGRTFLRELFALLHRVKQPHHYTRLSAGARADIMWWKCLLQHWSGHSFFSPSPIAHHIYSDMPGSWGCGAIAEMIGWFQVPWTQQWLEVDISVKELVPVAIAAGLWGPQWSGKHICFHSDNMAVVAVLQRRSAKYPPLMHLLRCVSLFSAFYCFHLSARHVPGVLNGVADVTRQLMSPPLFHRYPNSNCPTGSTGCSSPRGQTGALSPGRNCSPAL